MKRLLPFSKNPRILFFIPVVQDMKLRNIVIALLFCCTASADEAAPKTEKSTLIGKWQMIDERLEKTGMVIVWQFTANEVIVSNKKTNEEISRTSYTIDDTKKPCWITSDLDDSQDQDGKDRRLGIFRMQRGELHVKQEISDGGKRPQTFHGQFRRFKAIPKEK